MATLGHDGAPYPERLAALARAGRRADGRRTFTAQAFIITDLDDNQITAFHPGAMNRSHENRVERRRGHRARHRRARTAGTACGRTPRSSPAPASRSCSIPARGCRCSPGDELLEMIEPRRISRSTITRRGCWPSAPADARGPRAPGRGAGRDAGRGGLDDPRRRPGAGDSRRAATALVDPTGCGDAYRAGLLYGIAAGTDWETTGRLASVLGSLKIASAAARTTPSTATRSARATDDTVRRRISGELERTLTCFAPTSTDTASPITRPRVVSES